MQVTQRTVKVKKTELLAKLESNLKEHKTAFETASKVWADDMTQASAYLSSDPLSEKYMRRLQEVYRDKPRSYADSYGEVIMQLSMEVREELDLSLYEFNQLVCDKWDWSSAFVANSYSGEATKMLKAL